MAALLGRLHGGHVEVRAHAVGDEGLGAVHDVLAVLAAREGLAGRRRPSPPPGSVIASAPIFSPLIAGHEPALLLLLGAELEDRRRRDAGVAADPGRHAARAAARHLLGEDRVVHVVAALAAVLLRVLEPEEAELAHAREQLARELPRLLPLGRVRADLLLDERAERLAQRLVLLGEGRDQSRLDAPSLRAPVAASGPAPSRSRTSSQRSSVVWPRPAWSKPSRSPWRFFASEWW